MTTSTKPSTEQAPKPRRRGGVGLFLRQVASELRKVVYPTRSELITYTWVVLVFVCAVMLFVSALDFGFSRLVILVFTNGNDS